jgi:hypothetical protein
MTLIPAVRNTLLHHVVDSKTRFRRRTFHVLNLMQMSSNKELRSLTLGSAHEKFDVWTRPNLLHACPQANTWPHQPCYKMIAPGFRPVNNSSVNTSYAEREWKGNYICWWRAMQYKVIYLNFLLTFDDCKDKAMQKAGLICWLVEIIQV